MSRGRWAEVCAFSCLVAAHSGLQAQQHCDTASYPLSSPTQRFEFHDDGTVTDRVSNLMWMRCSTGQTWSAGSCVGQVEPLNWQRAQGVATEVNARGDFFYTDWRLPQIRELATLAERECESPRINLGVFPNTPASFYWTVSTRSAQVGRDAAYALSFGADGIRYEDKGEANPVRLVRSAR